MTFHKADCCNSWPCWGQVPSPSSPAISPDTASMHKGAWALSSSHGLSIHSLTCRRLLWPRAQCVSALSPATRVDLQNAHNRLPCRHEGQSQVKTVASWVLASLAAQCPDMPKHALGIKRSHQTTRSLHSFAALQVVVLMVAMNIHHQTAGRQDSRGLRG